MGFPPPHSAALRRPNYNATNQNTREENLFQHSNCHAHTSMFSGHGMHGFRSRPGHSLNRRCVYSTAISACGAARSTRLHNEDDMMGATDFVFSGVHRSSNHSLSFLNRVRQPPLLSSLDIQQWFNDASSESPFEGAKEGTGQYGC